MDGVYHVSAAYRPDVHTSTGRFGGAVVDYEDEGVQAHELLAILAHVRVKVLCCLGWSYGAVLY